MKLPRGRGTLLVLGTLIVAGIALFGFCIWLPDQRFVGTWAFHASEIDGEWQVRYDWDGNGAYRNPVDGLWIPSHWYAKGGRCRLSILLHPAPVGVRQKLVAYYDRIIHRGWIEYEILSIEEDTIEMRSVDMHQLVTLKRLDEPATN